MVFREPVPTVRYISRDRRRRQLRLDGLVWPAEVSNDGGKPDKELQNATCRALSTARLVPRLKVKIDNYLTGFLGHLATSVSTKRMSGSSLSAATFAHNERYSAIQQLRQRLVSRLTHPSAGADPSDQGGSGRGPQPPTQLKEKGIMGNSAQIDQILRRASDAGEIPGVAATVGTSNDVIYHAAFGKRLSKDQPMTTDSVFWIASMTKAITAAAAMQLVDQGKLSLNEPIGKLLPDLANPQVLEGFGADGAPKLRPAKAAITLRHLMTHTAGFCYDVWNDSMATYLEKTGTPSVQYLQARRPRGADR